MNTYGISSNRGLYAITNGARDDLLAASALALEGGARMLQYRDLSRDGERRLAEASGLARLCRSYNVPLIIDHDITLALEVGAHGVHLGRYDDPAEVRGVMGMHAIIGVSCHDSLPRAPGPTTCLSVHSSHRRPSPLRHSYRSSC